MHTIVSSTRLYFWPIIFANTLAVAVVLGSDIEKAVEFSAVLSLLSSFGFLLNDLYDRKIDLVNEAGHFERSGRHTIMLGLALSTMLLAAALLVAASLGPGELNIAFVIALALAAYTLFVRKLLLIPSVLTGFIATSPIWAPFVLWSDQIDILQCVFVVSTILIMVAREIMMDIRDQSGDFVGGRDTFPLLFGARVTKVMVGVLISTAAVLLLVVVVSRLQLLDWRAQIAAVIVSYAFLHLIGSATAVSLRVSIKVRHDIKPFVIQTRIAMLVSPVLLVILW